MNEIILLNQVTGPLFIDIANAFAKKYDNVTLVTGNIEATSTELNHEIKVVYKTRYKRQKAHLRILTWFLFFIQAYIFLHFKKGTLKVLFVSNPPLLPFLGSLFSKRKNFTYDILVYDVYPDVLVNFGYIKKGSFFYNFWERMNIKTYTKANRVFTISEVMKDLISRSVNKEKVEVVYPWVDTTFIKPIKKEENWFAKKYDLVNKKVILYSGNMGATHDLLTILKVADKMKNNHDFHFMFIGDGVQKKKLLAYKEKHHLNNVTFLPFQDAEILPYSFTSADFGVVSLGSGAEALSVPSKTFYQFAAGNILLAITEDNSELSNIIDKNQCGIVIQPGRSDKLYTFLINLSRSDFIEMKKRSRKSGMSFTPVNALKFVHFG